MMSVCIYCGQNKTVALEECASCFSTPSSHKDEMHSIIMCFSETDPYLNFLSIEEIETIRERILEGLSVEVDPGVFQLAEEAYRAATSKSEPKIIQGLASISTPILAAALFIFIVTIFLSLLE